MYARRRRWKNSIIASENLSIVTHKITTQREGTCIAAGLVSVNSKGEGATPLYGT